jgi:hypothetical protein
MLIADAYVACPENLAPFPLSDKSSQSVMFELPFTPLHLPRHFTEWVLPDRCKPVNIYCQRFGGQGDQMKATHLAFNAECEMRSLLEIKGPTKGRNTNALGDLNCHILISPPVAKDFGGNVAVAKDKVVTLDTFTGPLLDVNYSIMEIERFSQHAIAEDASFSPSSLGLKLASFRLEQRLTYSTPPEWKYLLHADLKLAIDFFDPAAIFFADLSFLRANHHSSLDSALTAKGFATTSHIRDALLNCAGVEQASCLAGLAMQNETTDVGIRDTADSNLYRAGYGYYLALLAYRKLFAKVIASDLVLELGREPSIDECLDRIEEVTGLPGRRLAEVGCRNDDPGLFFNEELLVLGLITAFDCGTDVVFLTHDPLTQEQFVKLCESVSSDYASYAFARSQTEGIEKQVKRLKPLAPGDEMRRLYESNIIHCELADDWMESSFPKAPYLINLHCWLVDRGDEGGYQLSAISYCLERPTLGLLMTKAESNGRNLSNQDGINLRVSCAQPNGVGAMAMLGRDRIVALGSRSFPRDDRLDLRIEGLPAVDLMKAVQGRRDFTLPA